MTIVSHIQKLTRLPSHTARCGTRVTSRPSILEALVSRLDGCASAWQQRDIAVMALLVIEALGPPPGTVGCGCPYLVCLSATWTSTFV